MISCYYSNVVFDNRSLVTQLILAEMRWKELCQAALSLYLCSGTLQAGGEQKAPLWSSCLQCTQLPAVYTAVCREHGCLAHSCPHGTQLSPGCRAVCRMSQCSHGTQLCLGHSYLRVHSCPMVHSCLWVVQMFTGCTSVSGHTAVCSCRIPVALFFPKCIHLNAV